MNTSLSKSTGSRVGAPQGEGNSSIGPGNW